MGNRRWLTGCIVAIVALGVGRLAYADAVEPDPQPVFCDAVGYIPGAPVERGGGTFYLDSGPVPTGPCGFNYIPQALAKVDRVIYADCVVVNVDGSMADAASVDIPCDPDS